MSIVDVMGHISYLWILVGMAMIGRKSAWGWLVRAVGEIGWLIIGIYMCMSSIWVWGAIFLLIDLKGFFQWRRESKKLLPAKGA